MRHLDGEVHLLKGFVRFSEFDGMLAGEIRPKNRVLPLLRGHFCSRMYNEVFLLYDRTHLEKSLHPRRKIILTLEFRHGFPISFRHIGHLPPGVMPLLNCGMAPRR